MAAGQQHKRGKQQTAAADDRIARVARERFGVAALRPGQREVIAQVLAGRDTLAVMPTGAGKSLTYQIPALLLPGVTVVVSPLIALMKDQADKLATAGVTTAAINSTLAAGTERAELAAVASAEREIVLATPERLADPGFIATLRANPIDLLVIDEVHCISQWGHDFRPAFLELGRARRALGSPPVLALTATATPAVIDDVRRELGLTELAVINTGIYRPNLRLGVTQVTSEAERSQALAAALREQPGSGIVYTATVRACDELAAQLERAGEPVARYHGRLPVAERRAQQDQFMAGTRRVMVATNAFGMGIDKPDLRFVIHYQMPGTLEAYTQEAGRAGRDGAPARCQLLFFRKDRQVQQFFLVRRYPGEDEIARIYGALPPAGAAALTLSALGEATRVAGGKLQVALKLLRDAGLAQQTRQRAWRLTTHAAAPDRLRQLAEDYRARDEQDRRALEKMVVYAQSATCRWRSIVEHFAAHADEAPFERCGHCDNCVAPLAAAVLEEPAPAIETAPAARPAFAVGDAVRVARYGLGRVSAATADQVTVEFDDGLRVFVADAVDRAGPEH